MATTAISDGPEASGKKQAVVTHSLTIRSQDGTDLVFKVKPSTKFSKLINAYCQKRGVKAAEHKFMYDGKRLTAEQTPADFNMEDGDMIDAMVEQGGG